MMGCISLAQVRIPPSPHGKYRFSNKGSTSDDFSGARRGYSGVGVPLSFPRGAAALPGLLCPFVHLAVFPVSKLCSCPPTPPPSKRQSQAFEVGRLTQHSYPPVSYLASCLWPAPSPRLHCTDNGIILSFCWETCQLSQVPYVSLDLPLCSHQF